MRAQRYVPTDPACQNLLEITFAINCLYTMQPEDMGGRSRIPGFSVVALTAKLKPDRT